MDLANAETLARAYMDAHGLADWSFGFDRAKRRLGQTDYATRTITISRHYAENGDRELVRNTMLHEIAHALVGPGQGHGAAWQEQARTLGIDPRATAHDIPELPAKYIGTCPNGHAHTRHRRPRGQHSCLACAPRFDGRYLIRWVRQY